MTPSPASPPPSGTLLQESSVPPSRPGQYRAVYEVVFCIFLGALGFLFRHQSGLVYPHLLYTFAAFLAFNFLFGRFLKGVTSSEWPSHAAVFVNGILITWSVHYSGGPDSYLWVMYLLPLFTACLLFDRARVLLSTGYVLALLTLVFWQGTAVWEPADWLQLFSRQGLLVLSVVVTARLSFAERAAKAAVERERRRWEESLRGTGGADKRPEESTSSETLLGRSVHDLNSALAVILGSVQLMSASRPAEDGARDDFRRIEAAVRTGKMVLQNLALTGARTWALERHPLRDAVADVVEQTAAAFAAAGIRVERRWTAPSDEVLINPLLTRQALVNLLLFTASVATEGEILVEGRPAREGGGVEVTVAGLGMLPSDDAEALFDPFRTLSARGRGFGVALHLSREILRRQGGDITLASGGEGRRFLVRLPLAAPTESARAGERVEGFRAS